MRMGTALYTFRQLRTAILLRLPLEAAVAYDHLHHKRRGKGIKLSAELNAELQSFIRLLNHGMSKRSIHFLASWLRGWFGYLGGEKPTVAKAEEFLKEREDAGYSTLSVYDYRRAIIKYFDFKGESVTLSRPKLSAPSNNHSNNHLGLIIDGKLKWIYVPNKRARPDHCELCGKTLTVKGKAIKLDYHHWDSADFSKGLWLCYRCHAFAEASDDGVTTEQYLKIKHAVDWHEKKEKVGATL